jgi:uncharacterized protein YdeI (YjbR/CyaY-like superfamily)
MPAPKNVEDFIQKKKEWKKELELLRSITLSLKLEETIKWGAPVYCYEGKNIVGLGAFKSYVGLWFFQGVFLKDTANLLVNAQEEKTKALRQWRFYSMDEIDEKQVKEYVKEAIENQKKGKEVKPNRNKELIIPIELQNVLKKEKELNIQFQKLSQACKREYAEYVSEAKREETKLNRLEKIKPMILAQKGLNDRYKSK